MDGSMDGWMDGLMGGWMDGKTLSSVYATVPYPAFSFTARCLLFSAQKDCRHQKKFKIMHGSDCEDGCTDG